MRWLLIAAIWVVAGVTALQFAAHTTIGPVVYVIDQQLKEGVHLGDVVFAAACCFWAGATSRAAFRKYAAK
jgi:hypothetical protein